MHLKVRSGSSLLSALGLLVLSLAAKGTEIIWDYDHGWTKGFVMTINTDLKKVQILDRETELTITKELINAANLGDYLIGLAKRIPEAGLGKKTEDGVVNHITIRGKETKLARMVYRTNPPGAIHLNEGFTAAKGEEEAAKFRQTVDGYLLVDMLFKVQSWYFGKEMAKQRAEKHLESTLTPEGQAR